MSEDVGEDGDATGEAEPVEPSGGSEAPLSELADKISERRRQKAAEGRGTSDEGTAEDPAASAADEAPGSGDDPFEEMSVSEIDEETLWASLADDAGEGPELSVGADTTGESETRRTARAPPEPREHVVSKESYCQKCPHLSDPPELTCTHEGTEIIEVVDSEHFRVRECPMVEE